MKFINTMFGNIYTILLAMDTVRLTYHDITISRYCGLTSDQLTHAHEVRTIVLENCHLKEAGLIRDITRFKNLTSLYLHRVTGDVYMFLENVSRLKNLKKLEICETLITEVPTSIYQLRKLEHLAINYTRLEALPPGIGALKGLTSLEIIEYNAVSLPENIKDLIF